MKKIKKIIERIKNKSIIKIIKNSHDNIKVKLLIENIRTEKNSKVGTVTFIRGWYW